MVFFLISKKVFTPNFARSIISIGFHSLYVRMKFRHMKNLFTVLGLSLFFMHCAPDTTVHALTSDELRILETFQQLPSAHRVRISEESEPGQKLWLCLTFVDQSSEAPLRNQALHLYHTNAEGEYEPTDPDDETTARLNGSAVTNSLGQLFVQTILPGDYGSSSNNRHIHTTVSGARPEYYDIHFSQYAAGMGRNFIGGSDQHFLADLKVGEDSILVTFLTMKIKNPAQQTQVPGDALPSCEWCGADEAPESISWQDTIADPTVEGERLILEGTVFHSDGKTPAENIIVYAYHTNDKGLYEKKGNETGNGRRHGYLRGWVKTNEAGQYQFYTIKPEPYPSRAEPAHVHLTLKGDDFKEYWIESTVFEGDPLITKQTPDSDPEKGRFSHIIPLEKNAAGAWVGKRDILLRAPKE